MDNIWFWWTGVTIINRIYFNVKMFKLHLTDFPNNFTETPRDCRRDREYVWSGHREKLCRKLKLKLNCICYLYDSVMCNYMFQQSYNCRLEYLNCDDEINLQHQSNMNVSSAGWKASLLFEGGISEKGSTPSSSNFCFHSYCLMVFLSPFPQAQ